jgi:hypothetical protein
MAASQLRRGISVLALSGLVFTVAVAVRGGMPDPKNAAVFAEWARAPFTRFAWTAILGGGVLELIGLGALFAALQRRGPSTSALGGWVLSTAGLALAMPLFAFMAMAAPTVGALVQQGDARAFQVVTAFFGGTRLSMTVLMGMTIAYVVGCVLTAVSAWRHTRAPKWAAVAFVLHAPLLSVPVPFALEITGGVLLLAAAVGFLSIASEDEDAGADAPARHEAATAAV